MIFVRCAPQDYDNWAALGNPGWAWADVLPVFKSIENYDGPASPDRGTEGLLDVTVDYELAPIQQSIIEAAKQIGIPENPDYNSGELDGISKEQVTVRGGQRLSTWRAYAQPVIDSPCSPSSRARGCIVCCWTAPERPEWSTNGRVGSSVWRPTRSSSLPAQSLHHASYFARASAPPRS